jgi:hypothetical protein
VPVQATPTHAAAPGTDAPESSPPPVSADNPVTVDMPAPGASIRELPDEEPRGTGFWLAAGRDGDLRVEELGDELIVAGSAALARERADGALERMPDMLRGLVDPGPMYGALWELKTLGGSWPDPVWMHTQYATGRSGLIPYLYYRKGERWQRKATRTGPLHWYYQAFAPWTDGRVLALRLVTPAPEAGWDEGPPSRAQQQRIAAAIAANAPRIDVLAPAAAPSPAPMQLAPTGRPVSLVTLPTGEVFVLLIVVEDGKDITAVQRFAPGASTGTLELLAEVDGQRPGLMAGPMVARGDVVYLAGGSEGIVLRRDGPRWQAAPPLPRPALSFAVDPADTMWAVTPSGRESETYEPITELWKRAADGPWTMVRLPQVGRPDRAGPRWVINPGNQEWILLAGQPEVADKLETLYPRQVLARANGDIWLIGNLDPIITDAGFGLTRHVALRSRPVPHVLELPDSDSLRAELLAAQPAKPWGDKKCYESEGWVQVATLPASAAPDAAEKLADELVATVPAELQREFAAVREVEVHGRRVVGLLAHPSSPANEQAILVALAKFGPEKRRFECFNPRPIRQLKTF